MVYRRIDDAVERNYDIKYVHYCNLCFSFLLFIIMLIIACELTPVAKDAGILIHDAGETLEDYGILIPKINGLIPEAKNTTRILGRLIPEIKQGLRIMRQLCYNDPNCHIY